MSLDEAVHGMNFPVFRLDSSRLCVLTPLQPVPACPLLQQRGKHTMGSQASELLRSRKILLAFDFDHTIVDGNTDTWVTKAAPGGDVPLELRNSYERGHWTEYMQRVLAHLHASGVTIADMQTALQQLQYTAGMEHLWQHLEGSDNCCSIILSDSNSQFIDWILSSRGHSKVFSNVYTNPAVVSDGQLLLSPYHSHSCSSCPCNMCKRAILQDYQQQSQQQYDRVLYIGDGSNDLCPTQALRPVDIVFVRAGYALDKLLQETAVERSVAAEIVRWNTGHDIVQRLKQL